MALAGALANDAFPMTRSEAVLATLQAYESRNVTYVDPAGGWPVVWARARGCHVWDEEGRRYLDLTAAFGVAAAGHANPRVVRAGQRQMGTLLHAMGDVHPHALKAELARRLSETTFGRWRRGGRGKVIFGSSGFEAVEAALKTARLATGRPGVVVFTGAYHGVGYGALNVTHRGHFRDPFRNQLREFGRFVPFPSGASWPAVEPSLAAVRAAFAAGEVGAILVEPVQARGGIRIPHPRFLRELRRLADEHQALLILDEIYTGFGRTGAWFATEHSRVVPDLICLGKALTGGFPLSACVGQSDIMDAAWPPSDGEAIHTSTFLGHPVGCAMALAQLEELEQRDLPGRAREMGKLLVGCLQTELNLGKAFAPGWRLTLRAVGLMVGVELHRSDGTPATRESLQVVKELLAQGVVVLPEGEHAEVIGLTPPLTLSATDARRAVRILGRVLRTVLHGSAAGALP